MTGPKLGRVTGEYTSEVIPIHEVPYPRDKRIAPEEFKLYRVRAKLIQVRAEKDSDLHLIIEDLARRTFRLQILAQPQIAAEYPQRSNA